MGQKASPVINKFGTTMYWNNMWDDKLNYSKKLKEDIFINMFFLLIFNTSIYNNSLFFSLYNIYVYKSFLKKSQLQTKPYNNMFEEFFKTLDITLLRPNNLRFKMYYMGRIWILRFQKWYFIVFTLYIPQTFNKNDIKFFFKNTHHKNLSFLRKISFNKNTNSTKIFLNEQIPNNLIFMDWFLFNVLKINRSKQCLKNNLKINLYL